MQSESRRAAPQASQPPSKASARTFNSTAGKWKFTADFRIRHIFFIFFFFDPWPGSCQPICGILITNESFSSAKAALVCSSRVSGKNCRHLGCRNVMRRRGCAVQNKGITLKILFNDHVFSCNWKYCLHGSHIWITSITLPWNWFIYIH